MRNIYAPSSRTLSRLILLIFVLGSLVASAETSIKLATEAPAGTNLRLYMQPYGEGNVKGLEAGDYFGEYKVPEGSDGKFEITGEITQLECYGCQLTEFDIVSAPELMILKCYNNSIPRIEVGANTPKLEIFECGSNLLTKLDISACPTLEGVKAGGNKITEFISGDQAKLTELDLSDNQLASVDLSKCTALTDLYIQKNRLPTLDLSANTKLNWIYAFSNAMAGDGMDAFVSKLPAIAVPSMLYLVDTRDADEGNRCMMSHIESIKGKGWVTCDFGGGVESEAMIGTFYKGYDYVPQFSNSRIFIATSRPVGEKVKFNITKGVGDIQIIGVEESAPYVGEQTYTIAAPLIQIQGDVAKLVCPDNDIVTLGFSDATALTELDCRNNAITKLDLAGCTELVKLFCQNNRIEQLNVADSPKITVIECYINRLRAQAMTDFVNSLCDGTENNPTLRIIDTKAPQGTAEENVALKSDVAIAKDKNWKVLDHVNGDRYGLGLAYEGSDPVYYSVTIAPSQNGSIAVEGDHDLTKILFGTKLTVKATPDKGYQLGTLMANQTDITENLAFDLTENTTLTATFVDKVLPEQFFTVTRPSKGEIILNLAPGQQTEIPDVEGAEVLGWNGTGLTLRMAKPTITVYGDYTHVRILFSEIDEIDVTHLPSLTELNVALNNLRALDLSGNPALETLSCEMNYLETIDLSANPKLDYLNCYGNTISGKDMTDMISSLPKRSQSAPGQLIVIDTTLDSEANICMDTDVELAKQRGWATYALNDGDDPVLYKGVSAVQAVEADDSLQWDPASGIITAEGPVSVYNTAGIRVINADGRADLSTLPAGIYIVRTSDTSFKVYRR